MKYAEAKLRLFHFAKSSMKKGNDKLTISIDESVKEKYKEVCDSEGLKIGKQIELFMIEELKRRGEK